MTGIFENAVSRLEAVAKRLETAEARLHGQTTASAARTAPAAGTESQLPPQQPSADTQRRPTGCSITSPSVANNSELVSKYDNDVLEKLSEFLVVAKPLGEDVAPITAIVEAAFERQGSIIGAIAACSRPDAAGLQQLVAPVGNLMCKATALADDRQAKYPQHNKVAAEALTGLSWPAYSGPACGMNAPPQHIADSWSSAEFWANKLLVQHRNSETGKGHVEWVKALKALMGSLTDYVRQYHATGPAWNSEGRPLASYLESKAPAGESAAPPPSTSTEPKSVARKPPPPPPMPAGDAGSPTDRAAPSSSTTAAVKGGEGGRASLLTALNQGDSVTSGLKKVSDDMKTKNRTDRTGVVPGNQATEGSKSSSSKAPPSAVIGKTPRLELEGGRKWVIEHHTGNRDLSVEITDVKQSVYIYNCSECTIQVNGKLNAITVDKCNKTGILFETTVASFEVVNSQSVQVQCTGIVPTVAIDKVDGCQVFIPKSSLTTAVLTAKSSEVNIVTPGATEDDDPLESALPEQFLSSYRDGQWITNPVSHSGG